MFALAFPAAARSSQSKRIIHYYLGVGKCDFLDVNVGSKDVNVELVDVNVEL